ncbi:hypothetical protein V8E55_008303 [Tylopilus felleus]
MSSDSTAFANVVLFHVGVNLVDILYGIELCLYFKIIHIFLVRRKARRESDVFYATLSAVMFTLVTIFVVVGGPLVKKGGWRNKTTQ